MDEKIRESSRRWEGEKEAMGSIHTMDAVSVRQMCSGQVMVDVNAVVKELIENSLDAYAKTLEIRLKEYGLDGIEVMDDGNGIEEEDWCRVGQRYCTSKLIEWDDVRRLTTFGFRGEALNSLCAVSDVTLVTRARSIKRGNNKSIEESKDKGKLSSSLPVLTPSSTLSRPTPSLLGVKLHLDAMGRVVDQVMVAREEGTTVSVSHLFKNLPVRQLEWHKNHKKEYHRCLQTIQAYALMKKEVRLQCYLITAKMGKQLILSTEGKGTWVDTLTNIFGVKQMQTLMEINMTWDLETVFRGGESGYKIQVEGYLSKPMVGDGRSSADRQFMYINQRPCDLPKITRMINEVYHMYNSNQYPFIMFNLVIPSDAYDVNVTPDKRTLLLHHEKPIMEMLRQQLISLFDPFRERFEVNPNERPIEKSLNAYIKPSEKEMSSSTLLDKGEFQKSFEKPITTWNLSTETSSVHSLFPKTSCTTHAPNHIHEVKLSLDDEGYSIQAENDSQVTNFSECFKHPNRLTVFDLEMTAHYDLVSLRKTLLSNRKNRGWKENQSVPSEEANCFTHSGLSENSKMAENELSRIISKRDFLTMEICGQFNLGFIVVKRKKQKLAHYTWSDPLGISLDYDLFIVDQHAADEKYNYEKLFKETRIHSQPLLKPLLLELSAMDEICIIEYKDIFQKNGFIFEINENAIAGRRIKLCSQPYSKETSFFIKDIEELIAQLNERSDGNRKDIRCSRVSAMFASRACRKSIMIGMYLNHAQMTKVIKHLAELDQPWNCPHGRPTMRHLFDLSCVRKGNI